MAKASDIARSRVTAADSNKWLAGIAGLIGAMVCAFAAVIFAPAQWGFFPLLGVGVAAVAVPAAIALRAMGGSSAEFKAAWLALLAAAVLLWVAAGGWLKRTAGMEMALREIAESERAADRRLAAMDRGARREAEPLPEALDSRNAFAMAAYRFRQFDARRVEHHRRYLVATDGTDWEAMSDPWKTGPAGEHKAKEARFQRAFDALDAWYAAELDSQRALRTDLAALGLPASSAQWFERRLGGIEQETQWLGYSERLLLERALRTTTVLDTVHWSREGEAIRFRARDDSIAYSEANALLQQAILNRASVRRQSRDTVAAAHR